MEFSVDLVDTYSGCGLNGILMDLVLVHEMFSFPYINEGWISSTVSNNVI